MRNCRDITALVSQGLDKPLGLRERAAVWLHVMMCSRCHNFQKQAQFLHKAARGYADQLANRLGKKS